MLTFAGISDPSSLRAIYNAVVSEDGTYYRPLAEDEFASIFGVPGRVTIAAYDGEHAVGFISATPPAGTGSAYLTFAGVLASYRRLGIASDLLARAEAALATAGASRIDTVFHDPAHLPWIIPGSRDGHPCAPGVASGSAATRFLTARGYDEWCAQIAYYLPLSEYAEPLSLASSRSTLADSGIEITLYNNDCHHGLPELFDAINNPGWKSAVLARLDRPVIVAVDTQHGNRVVGYTGPLTQVREGEGIRGVFCGIGTHPDYRGRGIAKQIFCEMCARHAAAGATFMSLYTGENNPARRVYEAAGCRGVVRWSNMRKTLSKG